jgi:hypothetical protein
VHDTREGVEFSVADPDLDLRCDWMLRTQLALSRSATR